VRVLESSGREGKGTDRERERERKRAAMPMHVGVLPCALRQEEQRSGAGRRGKRGRVRG